MRLIAVVGVVAVKEEHVGDFVAVAAKGLVGR